MQRISGAIIALLAVLLGVSSIVAVLFYSNPRILITTQTQTVSGPGHVALQTQTQTQTLIQTQTFTVTEKTSELYSTIQTVTVTEKTTVVISGPTTVVTTLPTTVVTTATILVTSPSLSLVVSVSVARNPISRGSVQTIYVTVTDGTNKTSDATTTGRVTYASGYTRDFSGSTDAKGQYSHSWQIGGNSNPGTFSVSVTATKAGYQDGHGSTTLPSQQPSGRSSRNDHSGRRNRKREANNILMDPRSGIPPGWIENPALRVFPSSKNTSHNRVCISSCMRIAAAARQIPVVT